MCILGAKLQTATENYIYFFFMVRAMTFLNNPNNTCESPTDLQKIVKYMTHLAT